MKRFMLAAVAAAVSFVALPASATTFDFMTSNNNAASWTKDGLTVTVTGWSTVTSASTSLPASGTATAWLNNGYGVINADTDNSHTIDNSGYYDFLRLEFSKAVSLDQVGLKAFGDTDAWISYGSIADSMTSSKGWATFLANGVTYMGGTADRTVSPAVTKTADVWLIGAGRASIAGSDDSFKLSSVAVTSAVPEPGTWAMMLVGFGMVGAAARRRRRATAALA